MSNNQGDLEQRSVSSANTENLIKHGDDVSTGNKILQALDIFSFLPVPRTSPISTKRSICGSFSLICIFFIYIIFSFVMFLTSNFPKMNQYSIPLGNEKVPAPKMAFGFVNGESLNATLYDPRYFSFSFQMVSKVPGQDDNKPYYPITTENCQGLDWIGAPFNDTKNFQFLCPNPEDQDKFYMQGLLLASPIQTYPRFSVNYCNNQTSLLFCRDYEDLMLTTSGGRIYLFTEQGKSKNYATGEVSSGQQNFALNYYFLVPGSYNRAELVMEYSQITEEPDYFTSFSPKKNNNLNIASENFYVSNVATFNPFSGFQIWLRLSDSVPQIDVVYDTIIDNVSEWGALWGLLFGIFAAYFLVYNTNKFYSKNEDWAEFDRGLDKIDQVAQQHNLTGDQSQQQEPNRQLTQSLQN